MRLLRFVLLISNINIHVIGRLSGPSGGRLLDVLDLLLDHRSTTRMRGSVHPKDKHRTDPNDEGRGFVHLLQYTS